MIRSRTLGEQRLNKTERATFIKHFKGEIGAKELQRRLKLTNTRYYAICASVLREAIMTKQVLPEELLNK